MFEISTIQYYFDVSEMFEFIFELIPNFLELFTSQTHCGLCCDGSHIIIFYFHCKHVTVYLSTLCISTMGLSIVFKLE